MRVSVEQTQPVAEQLLTSKHYALGVKPRVRVEDRVIVANIFA